MKLSVIFAKYLYQNKHLNLPGIGSFSVDPSFPVPDISDKSFHDYLQRITFSQKTVLRADGDFIDFIRQHTGKIKPLAESDLESFLSDGKILLNIGKPFHLEGIGTLQKNKQGNYDFTPGEPIIERLEVIREKSDQAGKARSFDEENDSSQHHTSKRILIIVAIIIGLIAVIWGGYSLYNTKTEDPSQLKAGLNAQDTFSAMAADSSVRVDSIAPAPSSTPGKYKFIIETTSSQNRVTKRVNQLKSLYLDIQVDSTSPGLYKLYFSIPAQPKDTSRIKDSLRTMYASKRILVEQ